MRPSAAVAASEMPAQQQVFQRQSLFQSIQAVPKSLVVELTINVKLINSQLKGNKEVMSSH